MLRMKQATLNLLAFSILSTIGCKSSDGKYVIYKIEDSDLRISHLAPIGHHGNSIINDYLYNRFINVKCDIDFKEEYVLIKSSKSDDLVLAKNQHPNGEFIYSGRQDRGKARIYFTLLKTDKNDVLLEVSCDYPGKTPIVIPAQLGQSLLDGNESDGIVCYLDKLED